MPLKLVLLNKSRYIYVVARVEKQQTRKLEGLVPVKGVQVQILSRAQRTNVEREREKTCTGEGRRTGGRRGGRNGKTEGFPVVFVLSRAQRIFLNFQA